MIPVTKPFLPPQEEYLSYVNSIWSLNWLTNNGPLVNEFELKLKEYLEVKHLLFVSNGTIALQMAIKALDLKGEIITTPFSYVATTSSIVWENCTPVFVDIDKNTLNIDPNKIELAITSKTSGILATHVYGIPCDVVKIEKIAKKYNLKVIYDGAHAFGVKISGKSIFNFGDISTTSFHATKIFHTVEGGAVFTKDPKILEKLALLRNFGHNGPYKFNGVGINGKNSEFHAAMGLANFKYINSNLAKRKNLFLYYKNKLKNLNQDFINYDLISNYGYFPVLLKSEKICNKSVEYLNRNLIFPRRYFYPLLSTLNYVIKKDCQIADCIAPRILCLPFYDTLTKEQINMIARIMLRIQNY